MTDERDYEVHEVDVPPGGTLGGPPELEALAEQIAALYDTTCNGLYFEADEDGSYMVTVVLGIQASEVPVVWQGA